MLILTAPAAETVVESEPVPPLSLWRPRPFRFGFIVTTEALYVPVRRSGLPLIEDLEQRRIPLADVSSVTLSPASFLSPGLVANIAMLLLWLAVFFPDILRHGPNWSNLALLAFVLPWAVRSALGGPGRQMLTISTGVESLHFVPDPSLATSRAAKEWAVTVQRAFLRACHKVGLHTEAVAQGSLRGEHA